MDLAAGTHTAKLQWRTFGNSTMSWRTFNTLLNGFGGGRQLLVVVHARNKDPILVVPTANLTAQEDVGTAITGISVADTDDRAGVSEEVAVTIAVQSGTLSLGTTAGVSFSLGDGSNDPVLAFSGPIASVNAALATVTYKGLLDFYGTDSVTVTVDDQGLSFCWGGKGRGGGRDCSRFRNGYRHREREKERDVEEDIARENSKERNAHIAFHPHFDRLL